MGAAPEQEANFPAVRGIRSKPEATLFEHDEFWFDQFVRGLHSPLPLG